MNVEQLMELEFVEETEVLGQKPPQRHFILSNTNST
jgi:hypothetical protein